VSIELDRVTKRFGRDLVLHAVSDQVPDGTLTALLGPSGSGKSTLLRVVAGLTPLDDGRVELNGRDVTRVPPRDRRIGFCFQDYAPFRQMTVFNNVAFGLRVQHVPRAERRARVMELLEMVRLTPFAHRYPHQLSGGQRQRMALVRALAVHPEVLLLDEPFAALDAQVRAELRSWVRTLQRELGVTTILVTHDQAEAMEVADRLVVLHEGVIQQVGAPAEVYDHPANEFVRTFLGPVTTFHGAPCRPHDLVVSPADGSGPRFSVVDVVRLGFEVRVVVIDDDGRETWVQITHHEAATLRPHIGQVVAVTTRTGDRDGLRAATASHPTGPSGR
jgi:sulfate/thiosulfate transport system ATP-binding protein